MTDTENPFTSLAPTYAAYRPRYPAALFAYLARVAPGHAQAWDCGTGSGQAAVDLAAHFDHVVATDASAAQLTHASAHPRIDYRLASAEQSGLAPSSVDLVTVAQAIHWFDLSAFYGEVQRVLRPDGVLAAWCYHAAQITPEIDEIVRRYYQEILGPYWLPEVQLVEAGYRTLPFPFAELLPPPLLGEAAWTLDELLGYLASWSATQPFLAQVGHHPLESIRHELQTAWGNTTPRRAVRWPLYLRVGRRVTDPSWVTREEGFR